MYNFYIKKYKKNKKCYKNNNITMLKISDAIRDILEKNHFFWFGIQHDVMNLAQLARFLRPLIEARTKKEISTQAIHMSLSRLQKNLKKLPGICKEELFEIEKINIQGNLCVFSYERNSQTHQEINKVLGCVQENGGYITISEGEGEITVIFDTIYRHEFEKRVSEKPKYTHEDVASIGVKFDEKYLKIPGLLYVILQKVSLQNINIIEIASTATEIIIYLYQKDAQLAFDTIYNSFLLPKK